MNVKIEGLEELCEKLGKSDLSEKEMVAIIIERARGNKLIELDAWLNEGSETNPSPAFEWSEDEWKRWLLSCIEEDDKKSRGRFDGISVYKITDVIVCD